MSVFPDVFDSLRSLLPREASPSTTPPDDNKALLQRLAAIWKLGTEGRGEGTPAAAPSQELMKGLLEGHVGRGYSALAYALAGYATERQSHLLSKGASTPGEEVELDTLNLSNALPLLLGGSPCATSSSSSLPVLRSAFSHYFGRSGYSATRPSPSNPTRGTTDPVSGLVGLGSMAAKCLDVLNNNSEADAAHAAMDGPSLAALWCPVIMSIAQHRSLSLFSFVLPSTNTNPLAGASPGQASAGGGGKASEILQRKLRERDLLGGGGAKKSESSKRLSVLFPMAAMCAYVRMSSTANVAVHMHWITTEGPGGARYRVVLRAVASKTIQHGEAIKLPAALLSSSCLNPPLPTPAPTSAPALPQQEVPLLTPSGIGAGLCSSSHLEAIKGLYSSLAKTLAQLGGEGSLTASALAGYVLPAPPTFLPYPSAQRVASSRMYPTRLPLTTEAFPMPLPSSTSLEQQQLSAAAYNIAISRTTREAMDANCTMAATKVCQVAEGIATMLSQGNFFHALYGDQVAAQKASSLLSLVSKHVEQQQRQKAPTDTVPTP
jgi:hypothetical protein